MKRRTFLYLTVSGAAALGIPWTGCSDPRVRTLAHPAFLSHICDETTLKSIGAVYLQQTPAEAQQDKLTKLLGSGNDLEKEVQADFSSGRTVIVKGWVLSLTEARQCALYSLIS